MTRATLVPLLGTIAIAAAAVTLLPAVCTTLGTAGYAVVGGVAVLASLISPFIGGSRPPRPGRLRVAVIGGLACVLVWLAGGFVMSGTVMCGSFQATP